MDGSAILDISERDQEVDKAVLGALHQKRLNDFPNHLLILAIIKSRELWVNPEPTLEEVVASCGRLEAAGKINRAPYFFVI